MKIGEIAQRTGVAASAIRYYEEQGLLDAPTRDANGYRHYNESVIKRLEIVTGAQRLGFSLDTIRGLFLHDGSCSKSITVEQINIRLEELQQIEATLAVQRVDLLALRQKLEESIRTGVELEGSCSQGTEKFRLERGLPPQTKSVAAIKRQNL